MWLQKLVIRADADENIGAGHLMRSFAFAQACKGAARDILFISHCKNLYLQNKIKDEGFRLFHLERRCPDRQDIETTRKHLLTDPSSSNSDTWLLIDGYHFDARYKKEVAGFCPQLIVVDDMFFNVRHHARILINQNLNAEKQTYRDDTIARQLCGIRYAMLRSEFLKYRPRLKVTASRADNILVTFGGADAHNMLPRILKVLARTSQADRLNIKAIAGPTNAQGIRSVDPVGQKVRSLDWIKTAGDMAALMDWADLAICAAGSTCWELAFMGVPFITVVTADNQVEIAAELAAANAACNAGWYNRINDEALKAQIEELLTDQKRRESISGQAMKLVDGKGCERIKQAMGWQ